MLAPDPLDTGGISLDIDERASVQKTLACVIALAFVAATFFAARYGGAQGPEWHGFLPSVATLWTCAELTTAILLANQFFLTGRIVVAWLAFAYGLTGLMTIPYLVYFPNVFGTGPYTPGDEQVSVTLWVLWHIGFPSVVAFALLRDPLIRKRLSYRHQIRRRLVAGVALCAGTAVCATVLVVALRSHLPLLIANGHFLRAFTMFVVPVVVVTNAGACALVLTRGHSASPLRIWLGVALFTATLDGLLNGFAPSRYSVSWYLGKVETLATSGIVLAMLLFEVSRIYRQMAERAMIDPLTGLRNRRELEQQLRMAFDRIRGGSSAIAMLIIDIDLFKKYNDTYGHAAGDWALQRIARALQDCGLRPNRDVVARYGGEEFVIVLTDTSAEAAVTAAAGIRERLAALAIPHAGSPRSVVTASIGIAYAANVSSIEPARLFDLADRALYAAKDRGRDRAVLFTDGTERARAPHAGRLLAAINDDRPREQRLRTGT